MATGNITIRSVQALAAGQTLWDAGHREALKGFGVRKQKSDPVYILKYRVFGRQRFFTIGKHGEHFPPEKARKEAKKLLGRVAEGKDPQTEKQREWDEAQNTVGGVVKAYLAFVKTKQKPRSYVETERHLLKNWKTLHPYPASKLDRVQIARQLAKLEKERGTVPAARARAALSAMFNWAMRAEYEIAANPVLRTNRPIEPKSRNRVLTDAELAAIWRACGDDDYGRIVRLLILTAQRRDEVGGMQWSELASDSWTIPGTRTKNHREHSLPLVPAALALIEAQPHRNDRDFVFGDGPRRKGDKQRGYSGWSKSKFALDKRIGETLGEPLPAWTIHDLRRTAATIMADRLGVLPHIVEAILNHVSGHRAGVAGVYNRARYFGDMRVALETWTREVSRIMRPKALTLHRLTLNKN
jgi:integrase